MRKLLMALLMVGLLGSTAYASVTMSFQGLGNLEPVDNYYNGGLGGFGTGPGPNYGVVWGSDSLAIINSSSGGSGNTGNEPSGGNTCLYFLSGPGDVMDVAAGFTTGFSFYYSAPYLTGSVAVYSGLDGTGTELAYLSLALTPAGPPGENYSIWQPVGVTFAGTAESAIFSGSANYIAFDQVTLGASRPPSTPEPATLLLLGSGLVGLAALKKRFRKA